MPVGQSHRNPVKLRDAKYFSSVFRKMHVLIRSSRLDEEGRIAIVTTRGARDAMDATCRKTCDSMRTAKACGPGALVAGAKLVQMMRRRR